MFTHGMFRKIIGLLFIAISGALGGISPVLAQQPYPNKLVTIIVPQGPGTEPDYRARLYAQRLSELWKVPVVVENKVGAGGDIGTTLVAKAPGDGYTLLMTAGSFTINPAVNKLAAYDPVRSFKPVMLLHANVYFTFAVSAKWRANTLQEFIAAAKARPGEFNYGSPGNGSIQHLVMEIFKRETGINLTHIPYKTGGAAVNDLAGGVVDVLAVNAPQVVELEKAGRVRILAILGPEPETWNLRNIPSVAELGYPGAAVVAWGGVLVPSSTPSEIVQKLNKDFNTVLALPDMQKLLFERTGKPNNGGGSPERLADAIDSDVKRWKKVVTEANIKAD